MLQRGNAAILTDLVKCNREKDDIMKKMHKMAFLTMDSLFFHLFDLVTVFLVCAFEFVDHLFTSLR